MRAGTDDRQAAVEGLTRHFTDGRLTAGEFDERVATAYGATYLDELPELFADLPDDRPRRANGMPGTGPAGHGQFGPQGLPGPWVGQQRWPSPGPPMRRPPRFLAVFVVLAVIFSISAVAHGFFPFPLIWVALVLLFMSRGGRRRRWAESDRYGHRR